MIIDISRKTFTDEQRPPPYNLHPPISRNDVIISLSGRPAKASSPGLWLIIEDFLVILTFPVVTNPSKFLPMLVVTRINPK